MASSAGALPADCAPVNPPYEPIAAGVALGQHFFGKVDKLSFAPFPAHILVRQSREMLD